METQPDVELESTDSLTGTVPSRARSFAFYHDEQIKPSPTKGLHWLLASFRTGNPDEIYASISHSDLSSRIQFLYWRYDIASRVVKNLRRKDRCLQYYIDYIQGEITKYDFKLKTQKDAVELREVDANTLAECEVACELVGEGALDSEELSVLLEIDLAGLEDLVRGNEYRRKSIAR